MLSRWLANTKRVLAHDKVGNRDYEFESRFPDGSPDGTPFSAAEMNKIIDGINNLSNPNLLINSDFRVHQRGGIFSNIAGGKYTADRWMIWCESAYRPYLTVKCSDAGGLTIENNNVSAKAECYLQYYLEDQDLFSLRGHKVGITYSIGSAKEYELSQITPSHTSRLLVNKKLSISSGKSIKINYVKAEIVDEGADNTTIPLFVTPYFPRPYAQEFSNCQRFYQQLEEYFVLPYARINGLCRFCVQIPTPMRIAPIVSGSVYIVTRDEGIVFDRFDATVSHSKSNFIVFEHASNTGLECYITTPPGMPTTLDAELYS